jgi:hypothetical protein
MMSVPPEDSAMRRAMSKPRPVEPMLERPRSVGSDGGKPGPSSATTSHAPPGSRWLSRIAQPTPSGVCANTFSSRMSAQVARSSRDTCTRICSAATSTVIWRSVSSASGRQNAARSATTIPASHTGSSAELAGRRASWMTLLTVRSTALTSSSNWALSAISRSDSASIRKAVSGVRSRCAAAAELFRAPPHPLLYRLPPTRHAPWQPKKAPIAVRPLSGQPRGCAIGVEGPGSGLRWIGWKLSPVWARNPSASPNVFHGTVTPA